MGKCAVPGCPAGVPATMLMCRSHWAMVPKPVQKKVWATWKALLAGDGSKEYRDARDDAIAAAVANS